MFHDYRGYRILRVWKYGYYYYRISGDSYENDFCRLREAKAEIDKRLEGKEDK